MTAPHSISSGSIWPLIETYVDACGHRAMDSTRIPEMESARRRLEEALGAAQRPPDYSAWLIETDELASINYFQMVDDDDWTFDHNKAMHFGRKEDADKMIAYYGWTRARAVEHMWPEASSVPSTHQNTPTTHDQQEK